MRRARTFQKTVTINLTLKLLPNCTSHVQLVLTVDCSFETSQAMRKCYSCRSDGQGPTLSIPKKRSCWKRL